MEQFPTKLNFKTEAVLEWIAKYTHNSDDITSSGYP